MQFEFPAISERMELIPKSQINKSNFIEIRLQLKKPQVYVDIDLLVVSDRGCKSYSLTLRPGTIRSRIIRLPKNSNGIFLKQKREPVELLFNKIEIVKFPIPITLWIIQQRLAHFKRKMPLKKKIIWRAYNQTFSTTLGIKNYRSWIRDKEKFFDKPSISADDSKITYILFKENISDSQINGQFVIPKNTAGKIFDFRKQDIAIHKKLRELIQNNEQIGSRHYCFIKEGEQIPKSAPILISNFIATNHQAIFYTDEDVLLKNKRSFPEFKPDWNPEYFMSSNYTGRSVIFPAWAVKDMDFSNFSPTTKSVGLLLSSALSKNPDAEVIHIPKICLHRNHEKNHERYQKIATTLFNICKRSECSQSVDIIIPTRDKLEILKPCIDSILKKSSYSKFQITIIDNNSKQPESLSYFNQIAKENRVRVLKYPNPFNYSAINNFAALQSKADVLLLVNNDIEVINADWIEAMLQHTQREEIGCVGAKLYYPNGWIQHAGVILGIGDIAGHSHRFYPGSSNGYMNRLNCSQRVSAVTAACLAVRRSIWMEVGGLDEKNLAVAYNDVDFCLKVSKAGYSNIWTPHAELTHHESISRGQDNTPEKRRRYLSEVEYMRKKWRSKIDHDPFYNPALSLTKEDFSLA